MPRKKPDGLKNLAIPLDIHTTAALDGSTQRFHLLMDVSFGEHGLHNLIIKTCFEGLPSDQFFAMLQASLGEQAAGAMEEVFGQLIEDFKKSPEYAPTKATHERLRKAREN